MIKAISKLAAAALTFTAVAAPSAAQQAPGYDRVSFVQAVRSGDEGKVADLYTKHGKIILDARDGSGDTPLIITIRKRHDWAYFFLQEGADPNAPGADGDTPLIAAARIGFVGIAEQLLAHKAKVDGENSKGETALIVAILGGHAPMARLLLQRGADPDKTDNVAGLSARDYAKRNTRNRDLLTLIESRKTAKDVKTPPKSADDFKL